MTTFKLVAVGRSRTRSPSCTRAPINSLFTRGKSSPDLGCAVAQRLRRRQRPLRYVVALKAGRASLVRRLVHAVIEPRAAPMRCPARGRAPSPPCFSARRCRPAAHADHHRDVHDEQGDMIGLGRLIQHRRRTADHGVRERVAQSHTQSADFGREQLRLHDGVDRRVAGDIMQIADRITFGPEPGRASTRVFPTGRTRHRVFS